jgi:predicted small integral membrane protein
MYCISYGMLVNDSPRQPPLSFLHSQTSTFFKLTVSILAAGTLWSTTKCWNAEFSIRWFHLSPKILISKLQLGERLMSQSYFPPSITLTGIAQWTESRIHQENWRQKMRRCTVERRLRFTIGLIYPLCMSSITTAWLRASSSTAWPAVHKSVYHLLGRAAVSPHPTGQFCSSFPAHISQSQLWKF